MTAREVAEVVVPHVVATYVAILGLGVVCPEDLVACRKAIDDVFGVFGNWASVCLSARCSGGGEGFLPLAALAASSHVPAASSFLGILSGIGKVFESAVETVSGDASKSTYRFPSLNIFWGTSLRLGRRSLRKKMFNAIPRK